MEFDLYKEVTLKEDLPEQGLKVGMRGFVIHIFDKPNRAYEVEFCNENGETIAQLALLPEQIDPAV
jgi:hypothetical protein